MHYPSSWQAYRTIKRGRARKKRMVYKKLLVLSFDLTTTIYSLILGGYVFATIFIFNDFLATYQNQFLFIEQQLTDRFWLILAIFPLRYVFQSFRIPGIVITSSEYQLGMLPYSMKRIAFFATVEKLGKLLLKYLLISVLVIFITPINSEVIVIYFGLFWLIELLMTIPQWKLFHMKWLLKLSIMLSLVLFNLIGTLTNNSIVVGLIIMTIVLLSNIVLFRKMFDNVNWGRVTEVNDYLVWNMPLVSRATKVKFKRQRSYSVFQNRASRKKPFAYTNRSIHKRIWLQHFRGNIEYVLQVVGGLFLAIIVLSFFNEMAGIIVIALSIHIYTMFTASIFVNRMYSGIVQVLPWDIVGFRKTIRNWAIIGFIPVMIPITIFSIIQFSWWSFLFIPLVISLFIINYMSKMDNAFETINKRLVQLSFRGVIAFCSLGFIILCNFNPKFSIVSIVMLIYGLFLIKKNSKSKPVA
ncbi:hypothetical protein [Ornithinibacillus sp. 179-J 7C1 HS]|uniref:hypothetical protein n=1 Tax=Ornithinibacillus sp. 179-J 7C1 HS TaxID=3142384 RepID=UPI0039A3B270